DEAVKACGPGGSVDRIAREVLAHGAAVLHVFKSGLTGNVDGLVLLDSAEQMVTFHSFIRGPHHKALGQLPLDRHVPLLDHWISHFGLQLISNNWKREGL